MNIHFSQKKGGKGEELLRYNSSYPIRDQGRICTGDVSPALQPGNLISGIIVLKSLKGFRFSAAPSAGRCFVLTSRKATKPRNAP